MKIIALVLCISFLLLNNLGYAQKNSENIKTKNGSVKYTPKQLPRLQSSNEDIDLKKIDQFLNALTGNNLELHSLMIVHHGIVVYENWLGDNNSEKQHIMNSVSKTFTATAIGIAVNEGLLNVTDKVISFFPDKVPTNLSDHLREMRVYDLLTMSTGNICEEVDKIKQDTTKVDWVKSFLSVPVVNKPGCVFEYNSTATYILSAILQKITGQKLIDYLTPRLFEPLGIVGAKWKESPQGITVGGSGLFIKTEDMAKLGQLFLQNGKWEGRQIVPASWIRDASSYQVASFPSGANEKNVTERQKNGDWTKGYGYQMWQCRYNAYRADGANGQFIIVLPEKDAVIVTTSYVKDMQEELDLIWKFVLPAIH